MNVLLSERCVAESLRVVVTRRAIRSVSIWFWQPVPWWGGMQSPMQLSMQSYMQSVRSCRSDHAAAKSDALPRVDQARARAGTRRRWSRHVSTGWPQSELVVDAQPQLAPAPVTGPPPVPRIWERSSGSLSLLMAPAAAAVEAPPPEVEEIEDTLQETQQEDRQPSVSVFDDMFDDCPELLQQLLQQQAVGAVDGVETAIKRLRLRGKAAQFCISDSPSSPSTSQSSLAQARARRVVAAR